MRERRENGSCSEKSFPVRTHENADEIEKKAQQIQALFKAAAKGQKKSYQIIYGQEKSLIAAKEKK